MDLAIEGRHALLFADDTIAAFVNSHDALVPWSGDNTLLVDRYDARHLLDRIPPRPPRRVSTCLHEEPPVGGITASEIDHERYLDLPPAMDSVDAGSDNDDGDARKTLSDTTKVLNGTFQAVPFSYGNTNDAADIMKSDYGLTYSDYRPPFPIPERLLRNLPPTEKLHQIIARTATFVSQHGGQSEIVLRVKQGNNPTFGFLMPDHHLHDYFRFLVDHPQLLKSDTTKDESQDKDKLDEQNAKMLDAGSGALSLLGSFYGSTEDDDGSHQADSEVVIGFGNSNIADILPVSYSSEQAYKVAPQGKGEVKSSDASLVSKEKSFPIKRKLPIKSSSASALYNKNARDGNVTDPGSMKEPRSSQSGIPEFKQVLLEPPSLIKRMIDKIVEFIIRNGNEFEAVLIEQDKTVGRFPFLLSSNQYHSYYLKVLEGAQQGNAGSRKKWQPEVTKESEVGRSSSDLSEGWSYDPHRKEKFKMFIGGSKKEKHDQQPAPATRSGVSMDEAAAIVLAATRGVSPANAPQHASVLESTARHIHGEAKHGSGIGSFCFQAQHCPSKPASLPETGTSLSLSGEQPSKRGSTTVDDVWIAKAIAKTAALVASCEADSSEASLTKEQKLKAERLKRAKMFAAMIKSGDPLSKMTSLATARNSSLDISTGGSSQSGAGSGHVAKEREGSSVPVDVEASGRVKSQEKNSGEVSLEYNYMQKRRSSSHDLDLKHEDTGGNHEQPKKRHRSEHSVHHSIGDGKHRKHHSSSKENRHRHHYKHHSSDDEQPKKRHGSEHSVHRSIGDGKHRKHHSSDDEYRHRKGSHRSHHRDEETSEDDVWKNKLSNRHEKKHHSKSQRNHDNTEGERNATNLDQTDVSRRSFNFQRELNMPSSDEQPATTTSEIPADLREKIRAMLSETM
ncbi:hypothetical protein Cni_G27225 [Canna indica]|uniref:SURP motif domain-containing protein n=1 Tax=Canna indica TaxID=4628 RepID=A0AAQ3L136_9LILI|nr:hypothetical protein Cni_G27225 [Canna indica]